MGLARRWEWLLHAAHVSWFAQHLLALRPHDTPGDNRDVCYADGGGAIRCRGHGTHAFAAMHSLRLQVKTTAPIQALPKVRRTMIFEVNLDATKALLRLDKGYKRMLYTAVAAVNDTARAVQAAERDQLTRAFTVRKREFLMKQVKLFRAGFDIPNVGNRWEARVGIGIGKPVGGSPLLLPAFETGAVRGGAKGGGVAIPVVGGARPAQAASVPEALFIQRLQLRRTTRGRPRKNAKPAKAGTPVRKGLLGTYQLPGVGIFQRTVGKVARLLYAFKPTRRLPARLAFYRTAKCVVEQQFARNVQKYVNEAFARHG